MDDKFLVMPPNPEEHLSWVFDENNPLPPPKIESVIDGDQIKIKITVFIPKLRVIPGHEKYFATMTEVTDAD